MKRIARILLTTILLFFSTLAGVGLITFGKEWQRHSGADCRVAVFMYHAVVPDSYPAQRFHIRHSVFLSHLTALATAGVLVPSPDDITTTSRSLRETILSWCSANDRIALITFDAETPSFHGELSVPALSSHDMPAAFFVVTGTLDRDGWVSHDEIRIMLESGMSVGSHSHTHPLFTRLDPDSIYVELSLSSQRLKEVADVDEPMLALPGGRYDSATQEIAARAGFRQIFTSDPCYVTADSRADQICRIEVRGDKGPTPLDFLNSPLALAWQSWSWLWKRRIESVMGLRLWDALQRYRSGY